MKIRFEYLLLKVVVFRMLISFIFSYFTALERPARSMLTSFFGTLVFPIGALFILTPYLELNGVWLSALSSCTLSAVFALILYLTLKTDKKESIS